MAMATKESESPFYNFKVLDRKQSPVLILRTAVCTSNLPLLRTGKGAEYPLSYTKDKVVLIVNTASKCSFTPQYQGLEELYCRLRAKYGDKFVILGFPCNQFLRQEPGSNDVIQSFCQVNYGVTFPVLAKLKVNGGQADPLYRWLKGQKKRCFGVSEDYMELYQVRH